MPIRDSLATLRTKGASYRTIAHILREADIEVSLDTLSRFCREHVEEPPPRKDKRRPVIRAASGQPDEMPPPAQPTPTEPDSPAPAQLTKETEIPPPPRGKGPRIADPSNI